MFDSTNCDRTNFVKIQEFPFYQTLIKLEYAFKNTAYDLSFPNGL